VAVKLAIAFNALGGVEYLCAVAREDPKAFCALLGKLIPAKVAGDEDNPLVLHATIDRPHLMRRIQATEKASQAQPGILITVSDEPEACGVPHVHTRCRVDHGRSACYTENQRIGPHSAVSVEAIGISDGVRRLPKAKVSRERTPPWLARLLLCSTR
jgi:hypothetical protein